MEKEKISQSERYKWIYDSILSKLYDGAMKVGLTPTGEKILRYSVYDTLVPIVKRGNIILDLCCGTGSLTRLLAQLLYSDCKIIGADLSSGQITQASTKNQFSNLEFRVMDANELDFLSNSIDIVIISAALHEMDKEQRLNVLKEVYRVLKIKGYLIIFDHHEPSKTFLRILYNFYLGFSEKIFSNSADMQRNIFSELKKSKFSILKQLPIKKFLNFFQIITTKK